MSLQPSLINLGPVFVVGCQRSGTTAVWQAISKHSQFRRHYFSDNSLPKNWDKELWYIQEFLRGRDNDQASYHLNWQIDAEYKKTFFRFVSDFISKYHGGIEGRWLSAHPRDALYLDDILTELPNATAIFLIRHPQEVVWSMLHAPWQERLSRKDFLSHADQASRHWNRFAEACINTSMGPHKKRVLIVKNERLRENPKLTLSEILKHINVKFEEHVLKTLLSGPHNSSFLSLDDKISGIAASRKFIELDSEFCQVISRASGFLMKEFGYKDLCEKSHTSSISITDSLNHTHHYPRDNLLLIYFLKYISMFLKNKHVSKFEKPRVLVIGLDVDSHFKRSIDIDEIEFYGFDVLLLHNTTSKSLLKKAYKPKQSNEMIKFIPYSDNYFDIVFTLTGLAYVGSNYVESLLKDILRVCKGHILHIERCKTQNNHCTSKIHENYWEHPLQKIYSKFGFETEKLQSISNSIGVLRIIVENDIELPYIPEYYIKILKDTEEQMNRYSDDMIEFTHAVNRLESENKNLKANLSYLNETRLMILNKWLENHPKISKALINLYDKAFSFTNKKKNILNTNKAASKLILNNDSEKILAVCHPHWQGVYSASKGQASNLLLLPETSIEGINSILIDITNFHPKYIILNGFWEGYDLFVRIVKHYLPDSLIYYVHHGSFYQMLEDKKLPNTLSTVFDLHRKGKIDRIGFVKQGMDSAFQKFGIDSHLVLNRVYQNRAKYYHSWAHPINAFIPASDHLRKNLHTQIIAALMIQEIDEIHTIGPVNMEYLKKSNANLKRIFVHNSLSHDQVLDIIDQSTFTIYVTISECAPMVLLESFAAGVPCISGATHGILSDNKFLTEMLVVNEEDSPHAIVDSIMMVKEHYEQIKEEIIKFNEIYDQKAKTSYTSFLCMEEN